MTFIDLFDSKWYFLKLVLFYTLIVHHKTSIYKYEYKLTNLYIFFNFLILLILLPLFSYPYPKIHIENFLRILNPIFTYAIMPVGKEKVVSLETQNRTPTSGNLWGFLFFYFGWQNQTIRLVTV